MSTSKHQPQPSFETPSSLSLSTASLLPPPVPRILFPLSLQGHDPTEVVNVWSYFTKEEGWHVDFATETGESAKADAKLLDKGIFRTVLGAKNAVVEGWYEMAGSREFINMKRFGGEEQGRVNFVDYDAVYLPGGQDNPMTSYFLSHPLHTALVNYLPNCVRHTSPITDNPPVLQSKPQHVLAALSQGVLPIAFAKYPVGYQDSTHAGKSILHNLESTTLPVWMETVTWGVSELWRMGEQYKARSHTPTAKPGEKKEAGDDDKKEHEYTEDMVKKVMDNPEAQYKRGPLGPLAFTHVDPTYHYISARSTGDAKDLAIGLAKEIRTARQRFVDEVVAGVQNGSKGKGTHT